MYNSFIENFFYTSLKNKKQEIEEEIEYSIDDFDILSCDSSIFIYLSDDSNDFLHFDDFILEYPLILNKKFISDLDDKYLSDDKINKILNDSFTFIINFIEEKNYDLNVVIIAFQIIFRFLEMMKLYENVYKYLYTVALKLSVQLEYFDSDLDKMTDVAKIFKLDNNLLIAIEKKIILKFKGDFYMDSIYHWFTENERKRLHEDKQLRNHLYKYVSNHKIYLKSSKENAKDFRLLYF